MPLEIIYTVIPVVIVAVIFYFTVVTENEVDAVATKPAETIHVDAYRWGWADSSSLTGVLARRHPGQAQALRSLQRHWWSEAHGDEDLGGADAAGSLPGIPTAAELDKLLRQIEQ